MITKTHIEMLEHIQEELANVPEYLPYDFVMKCTYEASLLTDVIKLCQEHQVHD